MLACSEDGGKWAGHQAIDGHDLTGSGWGLEVGVESEEGNQRTSRRLLAKDGGWCHHRTQHGSSKSGGKP